MFDQLKTLRLYDLRYTLAAPLLEQTVYPWEALSGIRAFIEATGAALAGGGIRQSPAGRVDP